MRLADGDGRPFWIALALTNPHPDHEHAREIKVQYYKLASARHVDPETYSGWDSNQGNNWVEETESEPTWLVTDCIVTAWKPRFRENSDRSRLKIPKSQLDIIKATLAEY